MFVFSILKDKLEKNSQTSKISSIKYKSDHSNNSYENIVC